MLISSWLILLICAKLNRVKAIDSNIKVKIDLYFMLIIIHELASSVCFFKAIWNI